MVSQKKEAVRILFDSFRPARCVSLKRVIQASYNTERQGLMEIEAE